MRSLMLAVLLTGGSAATAVAVPVQNPANGHYYEFFASTLNWAEAKAEAEAMTHLGEPGYLATITSAEENDFVFSSFGTGLERNGAWLGGEDGDMDGDFYWAGGPENGVQFSSGSTPTAPYDYANWAGVEPNLNPTAPTYAVMNLGLSFFGVEPGQWWDSPFVGSADPVIGYLVEFNSPAIPVSDSSWGRVKALYD